MRYFHQALETYTVFKGSEKLPFCLEGLVIPLEGSKLLATFTTGGTGEPRTENFTAITRSSDGGKTWSEPIPLFQHSTKGVFSTALYKQNGLIRIYLNTYRDDTNFAEDMQSYFSDSYDNGLTFTIPRSIPGCINNVHIKQAVWHNERLLLPFSWREIEGKEWIFPAKESKSKPAYVLGNHVPQKNLPDDSTREECLKEWHRWARENTNEYVGVLISDDQGKHYRICGQLGGKVKHLCEPTLAVLSDGSMLMYIRSNVEKSIFASHSYDNGESWSELERLDIPTPITKVRLYTRKNGDLLLLHNPSYTERSPLSLWISYDQGKTWPDKTDLITDSEHPLAYPDGFIDEDNQCLCFTWEDRHNIYFSKWYL